MINIEFDCLTKYSCMYIGGFEFFLISIWYERIMYYHPKHAHILDSGHVVFTCRLFNATVFTHERWLTKFCGTLYNIAFLKTVIVMLTAFRTWSVTSVSLCFLLRPELCKWLWELFCLLFVWTLNIIVGIGTEKVEENECVAVLPTYCLQMKRVRLGFLLIVSKWRDKAVFPIYCHKMKSVRLSFHLTVFMWPAFLHTVCN